MNKILQGTILGLSLAISKPAIGIEKSTEDVKIQVQDIINDTELLSDVEKGILTLNITQEEKEVLLKLLKEEEIRENIYDILKKSHEFSIHAIINSILLRFLYFLAYYGTIRNVKNEYMPINAKSFAIFGATSGGMALVNGFVPGSLLYIESFLLAFTAVGIHYYNQKKGNVYSSEESREKNLAIIREWANAFPYPVVNYGYNGEPIIWNKEMEKETGYTFEEILEYYNKNGDVMPLLYKGEDLEKVETYLKQIKNGFVDGYKDITFSLTIKSGEKKSFSWTTKNLSYGGNVRIARHITNEIELKRKLEETNELLRVDPLTGVLNKKALEEDLHNIFSNKPKNNEKIIIIMLDIDNFKTINDLKGHDFGDKVLVDLGKFLSYNLRKGNDKVYRYGGDEFVIIVSLGEIDKIIKKINDLRIGFNSNYYNIGTSWGLHEVCLESVYDENETIEETLLKIKNIKNTVDEHMYSVKYYHLILGELIESGKINSYTEGKNGLAVDIYDNTGEFVGVKVINDSGEFIIDTGELELISKRKEELSKTNSGSLR